MRNKIAWKLAFYFTIVLLLFSVGVGLTFTHFYREHTLETKSKEMHDRAVKIATIVGDNMSFFQSRYGAALFSSRLIRSLNDVDMEYVWLVDAERNLRMDTPQHPLNPLRRRSAQQDSLEMNPKEAYMHLSPKARENIEEVFNGKSFTLEEFNPVIEEIVLTVGVPVYNKEGEIRAAVLVNAPMQGMKEVADGGIRILVLSSLAALAVAFILSIIFSLRFTKPLSIMKDTAMRLADRDYDARCNIERNDEIGDLAKTIDVLSARLKIADEESQKLEEMRREFIANISHELRTPVTVIRGSLEALKDGIVTDKKDIEKYHEQMLDESVFLQRLINDLLDLSRLQNTDFPIEKETLNMCDVIHDAARSGRQLGLEKNIGVNVSLDTDVYLLHGDYGRLRQMMLIFMQNSIKFSEEGGHIDIRLSGSRITVTDYGCGISEGDIVHAFERFYKAPSEKNKEGSGLGLAIAKQIAMRHDMELKLTSEMGKYTCLTIVLPEKEKEK